MAPVPSIQQLTGVHESAAGVVSHPFIPATKQVESSVSEQPEVQKAPAALGDLVHGV